MSGKKGADWFEESERDKMNMLESCKRGNLNEVAKYLNGGIDADEEDDDGVTALQIASAKGHRRLVEFLIKEGASVEIANYAGMTPFLHACREGHQDIVTLLANYGANAHVLSGLGLSAMTLACAGRHLAVVRTLKSLNVAVDPKPSARPHQISPTPYMVAFFEMDIQICGFLKQQNAHIWHQIKRLNGLDVVRMGQLLGLPEILMRLNYTENTLQEPPKKVDIRLVIQSGDEQELTKLLREGEIPNNLQYGLTPLMYAAVSGQLRCAEILLKVGKGGAVDAQENVLGMTALMFSVVAGESLMVQLLLRYLANPRILSTTKEPFSALDLAMYSELNRECMELLCIHWLKKGGSKITGAVTRPREGSASSQNNQQITYRGAITPARLRKALESIGKNLIGLGINEDSNGNNNQGKEENGGLNQSIQSSSMLKLAAENVHQLIEGPIRFVLAEHILRGDARPSVPKKSSEDDLVLMARQMAISWMSKGHSLLPITSKNIGRMLLVEEGDERDSDGLYSAAQRNAEKELLKTKHRYEPSRKHSSKSTSRVMKNATQKSPQIDPKRIMRKAPHRLSQQKSHGCASDSGSGTSLNSNNQTQWGASSSSHHSIIITHSNNNIVGYDNSTIPQNIFYIPQHLTKELVKNKLNEWKLEEQFNKYFGAEEVDELTFVSLREEEVWQVLLTQGCQNRQLFKQFLALIQDIKKCTASSELL